LSLRYWIHSWLRYIQSQLRSHVLFLLKKGDLCSIVLQQWLFDKIDGLIIIIITSLMASSALQHWTASPTMEGATDKLVEKIVKHDSWPIQPDILSPPLLRLTSRKPLWLDLQPFDIKSRWRHYWKSAQEVNSQLVCDPTIRQSGFDLPRPHSCLLNHFHMEQGHCGACRRKWRLTDTDLCPCGETQTMSHIVESWLLTKLNGSLSRLHSADEDAVSWLTSYG